MTTLTEPYREEFVTDDDHPAGLYTFACNICQRDVGDVPCPDHAPTEFPGLRLVDCTADPPHLMWVHEREDYGVPCYACIYADRAEREAEARQCRHWPWRRWKLTHKVAGWLHVTGIASSGGGSKWGDGCNWCLDSLPRYRGKRVYLLGVSRNTWHCWRRRHRRGEEVGFGFCGKCMPWPCCGAETVQHVTGCREDAP